MSVEVESLRTSVVCSMSLFKYFKRNSTTNSCEQASLVVATHAAFGVLGVSEKEATKVAEELKIIATQGSQDVGRKTRVQSSILHGNRQAVTHFAEEFPKLNESCVGPQSPSLS